MYVVLLKPAFLDSPLLCRDEINRLTEILSSRVADLSNVDSEEKKLNMALKREGKGAVLVRENPRASIEEKKGDLDGARVDSLITLPQFAVSIFAGQPCPAIAINGVFLVNLGFSIFFFFIFC